MICGSCGRWKQRSGDMESTAVLFSCLPTTLSTTSINDIHKDLTRYHHIHVYIAIKRFRCQLKYEKQDVTLSSITSGRGRISMGFICMRNLLVWCWESFKFFTATLVVKESSVWYEKPRRIHGLQWAFLPLRRNKMGGGVNLTDPVLTKCKRTTMESLWWLLIALYLTVILSNYVSKADEINVHWDSPKMKYPIFEVHCTVSAIIL